MGLHRYVFDLTQISNWLNQHKLESEKVTTEELKTWADAGCFPVEKRGENYRVHEEVLPLVEETKHLIKTEDHTIEEAKRILQKAVHDKAMHLERLEKLELPSPDILLFMDHLHDETKKTIQETGNGLILGLTDTESALKEHQEETLRESEERMKGAVLHAEIRLKTVLERAEKRLSEHIDAVFQQAKTPSDASKDQVEALIQQHQETLLGLTTEHEQAIQTLQTTFEQQMKDIKETHANAYEELLCAGFFKRRQLKKAWQQKK